MRLTSDNSNATICSALMGRVGSGMKFYCPKTNNIFVASPCENCGSMSAHGGCIHIDVIDNELHRTLSAYYKVLDYNEVIGFDDDGMEVCEDCSRQNNELVHWQQCARASILAVFEELEYASARIPTVCGSGRQAPELQV